MSEEKKQVTEAKVTIGGEVVPLPPLKFKGLKAIWGRLREIFEAQSGLVDPLDAMDAMIAVVAASVAKSRPDLTVDEIEERLEPSELAGLTPAVYDLLEISGIKLEPAKKGEDEPVGQEGDNSPATSPNSSVS